MRDLRSRLRAIATDPESMVADAGSTAQALLLLSQTIALGRLLDDEAYEIALDELEGWSTDER
ncbi:hypothetical protein GCM10028798_09800 [Humibacter antri]